MTINQILKWRKDVLAGKSKYYPKDLIESVRKMVIETKYAIKI